MKRNRWDFQQPRAGGVDYIDVQSIIPAAASLTGQAWTIIAPSEGTTTRVGRFTRIKRIQFGIELVTPAVGASARVLFVLNKAANSNSGPVNNTFMFNDTIKSPVLFNPSIVILYDETFECSFYQSSRYIVRSFDVDIPQEWQTGAGTCTNNTVTGLIYNGNNALGVASGNNYCNVTYETQLE